MRKLLPTQKKKSTLNKEAINLRKKSLREHDHAASFLADTFNALLHINSKYKCEINLDRLMLILKMSGVELIEERKNLFNNLWSELNDLYIINCKSSGAVPVGPINEYLKDIYKEPEMSENEKLLVELYLAKTDPQPALFYEQHIADRINDFSIDEYQNHPRLAVLDEYRLKLLAKNEYEQSVRRYLHLYLNPPNYSILKKASANRFRLENRRLTKFEFEKLPVADEHYFIFKLFLPAVSIYIEKIKNIKTALLRECMNPKCRTVFPLNSRRSDAKTCSKICSTEKNRNL